MYRALFVLIYLSLGSVISVIIRLNRNTEDFAVGRALGFNDEITVGLVRFTASDHFLGVISVALRPMPSVLLPYTDIQSDAFHTNFGVKRPATRSARPYWKK